MSANGRSPFHRVCGLSETAAVGFDNLAGRILPGFIETRIATWIRVALFTVVAGMIIVLLNVTVVESLGLMIVGFSLVPPFLITLTPVRMAQHAPYRFPGWRGERRRCHSSRHSRRTEAQISTWKRSLVFMTVAAILMWLLHGLIYWHRVTKKTSGSQPLKPSMSHPLYDLA